MLPLRFTFSTDSTKLKTNSHHEPVAQPNSPVVQSNSPVVQSNSQVVHVAQDKPNSHVHVVPQDSWSQRYSTPICLMLTAVAGFISGYNLGRYRSKC
jgi:hypothetical protein